MSVPAALLGLASAALVAACDEGGDETFASAADLAGMVERGWVPPLPDGAREVRVAWDLDLGTSFFCGEGAWADIRQTASAVEDAALPEDRPETAPDWWWEKARSGTEAIRVPRDGEGGWTLTRIAPGAFCGADLKAWRGSF